MKKNTISLLLAASALVFMAGCAGGAKNSAAQKDETVNESQAQTDAVDSEAAGTEEAGLKSQEAFSWLPADVVREKSETEPEELRKLIAEYYEIPDDELADSRYYYNYVDLDSDGTNEIFAVVVGSYTSGSGGSSALWCEEQDGALAVKQAFLERSGGGAETEYVKLSCTDGVYTNVSDAEAVSGLESVQGVAVLCNDLADDMQTGNYLTLEGV